MAVLSMSQACHGIYGTRLQQKQLPLTVLFLQGAAPKCSTPGHTAAVLMNAKQYTASTCSCSCRENAAGTPRTRTTELPATAADQPQPCTAIQRGHAPWQQLLSTAAQTLQTMSAAPVGRGADGVDAMA
jgi:hypothetical protein